MSNTNTNTKVDTRELVKMSVWHGAAIRVLVGIRLGVISKKSEQCAINVLEGKKPSTFVISNLNSQSRMAYQAIKEKRIATQAKEEGIKILGQYNLFA